MQILFLYPIDLRLKKVYLILPQQETPFQFPLSLHFHHQKANYSNQPNHHYYHRHCHQQQLNQKHLFHLLMRPNQINHLFLSCFVVQELHPAHFPYYLRLNYFLNHYQNHTNHLQCHFDY